MSAADVGREGGAAALRLVVLEALAHPDRLDARRHAALAAAPVDELDAALRAVAAEHGAAALPLLTELASEHAGRQVRRLARRALYRLAQRGVTPVTAPAARPVVARRQERASRAWLSGVDGSGSRAVWIVFEGGFGGASLCSLIVNDVTGIVEVAWGPVTKKRLAANDAIAICPGTPGKSCGAIYSLAAWQLAQKSTRPFKCPGCGHSPTKATWQPSPPQPNKTLEKLFDIIAQASL